MSLVIQELLLLNCLIFNEKSSQILSGGDQFVVEFAFDFISKGLYSRLLCPSLQCLGGHTAHDIIEFREINVESFNTFCAGMLCVLSPSYYHN